ncbi:MAG: tripartite tricarboxylate transporter substrate binding protein [Syntrophaceae bacterium]|nr:tripartite tricarboxylate transporter substrate binding protein [Syntrophaceae bacterium]
MRTQMRKTGFLTAVCFLMLAPVVFLTGAASAAYPEKEITVINGSDPGTSGDILARALTEAASKILGKPFVMEHKVGASGLLAGSSVAAAKPDGYTIGMMTISGIIEGTISQKAPFRPLSSFTPILTNFAAEHTVTIVAPNAIWKTFKELVDYAKKNPGKIKMGVSIGSGMHMAMEVVRHQEGINWEYVPFKGGAATRTAIMGGHVEVATTSVDWPPFAEAGQVRALVTHGRERSPHSPNVPTLIELGYNFAAVTPYGFMGPAGLSPEVTATLENAFIKAMETPEYKTAMQKVIYMSPFYLNSKDFGRYLRERWVEQEKFMKQLGFIKEAATPPE